MALALPHSIRKTLTQGLDAQHVPALSVYVCVHTADNDAIPRQWLKTIGQLSIEALVADVRMVIGFGVAKCKSEFFKIDAFTHFVEVSADVDLNQMDLGRALRGMLDCGFEQMIFWDGNGAMKMAAMSRRRFLAVNSSLKAIQSN